MIRLKNNFAFLLYFLVFFFLLFEIVFSEKNIFLFFNNYETLSQKSIELKKKEDTKNSLATITRPNCSGGGFLLI